MTAHILGAGAIGLLAAAHLRQANIPVTLFTRRPLDSNVIRVFDPPSACTSKRELRWEGQVPVDYTASRGSTKFLSHKLIDLLFVTTKTYQTWAALTPLIKSGRVGSGTTVVFLQNGFELVDAVLEGQQVLPASERLTSVVVGTTTNACYKINDTSVVHASVGATHFGWHPASVPPGEVSAAGTEKVLQVALPKAQVVPYATELLPLLLRKLCLNAIVNPLTALLNVQNGDINRHPVAQTLVPLITRECCDILTHQFPQFNDLWHYDALLAAVRDLCNASSKNWSSMQQDFHRRNSDARQTEIEFINGSFIRWAHNNRRKPDGSSVVAPWNSFLYKCINPEDASVTVSPPLPPASKW
ncbi:hypothetical protein RI367_004695 [Sorochytrium milnesiophthora]